MSLNLTVLTAGAVKIPSALRASRSGGRLARALDIGMEELRQHRVAMHVVYFKIAREHEREYWELSQEIERLSTGPVGEEEVDINRDRQIKANAKKQQAAVVAIAFAAMCLEAFFFDYAAEALGDRFVKTHLDKLNLPSRFAVYPKLVVGKAPNRGGQAFESIRKLQTVRNKLIHFKSKSIPITKLGTLLAYQQSLDNEIMEGVQNSTRAVWLVMKELDVLHDGRGFFSRRLEWSTDV